MPKIFQPDIPLTRFIGVRRARVLEEKS